MNKDYEAAIFKDLEEKNKELNRLIKLNKMIRSSRKDNYR